MFRLAITDDGEGIAVENLANISALESQAKSNKKRSAGFGLSNANQIVKLHQGTILAESRSQGSGTKFIIEIPTLCDPSGHPTHASTE